MNHLKAVIIRRLITIKRSWKTVLISIIGTLIACTLTIAFYWRMVSWIDPITKPISYKNYDEDIFVIVGNPKDSYVSNITKTIGIVFEKDTNKQAN